MKLPNHDSTSRLSIEGGLPSESVSTFFDSIQKWIRGNGGTLFGTSAQRTNANERGYVSPGEVADGTLYVETDTGLIYQWRMSAVRFARPSGSWVSLGGQVVTDQTLSAASTTINAPSAGSDWFAVIRQDGAGGRAITWGTGIIAGSVSLGTAAANSISVFHFVKVGANWIQAAQQTTDLT